MGQASRRKQKKIIHRTRLFGGKETAEEVHRRLGFRERCLKCKGPPVIQVRVLGLVSEVQKRNQQYWIALVASAIERGHVNDLGQPMVPTIPTTFGNMLMISKVTACRHHQKELELTAAKAPSWCLIEIDRGPGADRIVGQVPGLIA